MSKDNIIFLADKQKNASQFEEMQESFNEVLKEHNDNIDSSSVAKDMQKSYMKLFSNLDKK